MQSNSPRRPRDDHRGRRPLATRNSASSATQSRHPDAAVDQRIRELDAERDPLSLPEEIVSEANRAGERVGIPTST
jgi:transcription termination factor Rho